MFAEILKFEFLDTHAVYKNYPLFVYINLRKLLSSLLLFQTSQFIPEHDITELTIPGEVAATNLPSASK
jgi:hypothetical protein